MQNYGSFWENIAKLLGFTNEIYVILKFWICYLLGGIMCIVFIMFAELLVTFFQICAELWVQIF